MKTSGDAIDGLGAGFRNDVDRAQGFHSCLKGHLRRALLSLAALAFDEDDPGAVGCRNEAHQIRDAFRPQLYVVPGRRLDLPRVLAPEGPRPERRAKGV